MGVGSRLDIAFLNTPSVAWTREVDKSLTSVENPLSKCHSVIELKIPLQM